MIESVVSGWLYS